MASSLLFITYYHTVMCAVGVNNGRDVGVDLDICALGAACK